MKKFFIELLFKIAILVMCSAGAAYIDTFIGPFFYIMAAISIDIYTYWKKNEK